LVKIAKIYDTSGVKQKKIVPGKEILYAGNYIYEKLGVGSPVLQFFNHPEGYVNLEGGVYKYVYNYKDYLGDVRLSYTDVNGIGIIETGSSYSEIVEENNYYPFGLKHLGYNSNSSSLGSIAAKKYKFQGVELEEALGLNLYEMDFRQYDPAIARFTSNDPVTHHSMSPYMAFDGNPVFWADPSGADSENYGADGLTNNQWMEFSRPGGGGFDAMRAQNRTNLEVERANNASVEAGGLEMITYSYQGPKPKKISLDHDSDQAILMGMIEWAVYILSNNKAHLSEIIQDGENRPSDLSFSGFVKRRELKDTY